MNRTSRADRLRSLARCAGVHVDFHAHGHFDDLRCFPGHFRLPSPVISRQLAHPRPTQKSVCIGTAQARADSSSTSLPDMPERLVAQTTPSRSRAHRENRTLLCRAFSGSRGARRRQSDLITSIVSCLRAKSCFLLAGFGFRSSALAAYLSKRSSARPARDFNSFASSVPSLSGSAALNRCSTTARYSSSVSVPS